MNLKVALSILFTGIILAIHLNVHAQCDSTNASINSKIRFLGDWSANGKPDYLAAPDTISSEIKALIAAALPEKINITGTSYFNEGVQPNTVLTDTAEIYLTFVHEGATWNNVLGFYTYSADNPPATFDDIDSLNMIFPNIDTAGAIKPGDKVYLGKFDPGTVIGYFLIANGWTGDTVCLNKHIVFTDKDLNTFTNESNRQHTVLLYYNDMLLLGIEDQPRPSGDKDFNDAVFYITTNNFEAIDTADIPKIPVAEIFGDTVLCSDDAEAKIWIELFGTPPFDVVYNNGSEDILISNITENLYTFYTSERDTFSLVSVQSGKDTGMVKGQAIVQQSGIDADWNDEEIGACGDETTTTATIKLEGIPPFTLVYSENGTEHTANDITGYTHEINVSVGATYVLTEIHDAYCSAALDKSLTVGNFEIPSADVESLDTTLCAGTVFEWNVNFEGTPPFTFIYSKNGENDTITVAEDRAVISVTEDATLAPVKVFDAHCERSTLTGKAVVSFLAVPSLAVDATNNTTCGDTPAVIVLTFTGESPWYFSVKQGEDIVVHTSSDAAYELELLEGGTYEIINLSDNVCTNTAPEEFEVIAYMPPTAEISGSGLHCKGESAQLYVALTGTAPFNFTYTDGTNDYPVSTSDEIYTIDASAAGVYSVKSVEDAHCTGTPEGSVAVDEYPQPQAELTGPQVLCEGEQALLTIQLSGTAPFTFILQNGSSSAEYIAEKSSFEIAVAESGTYEITDLADANCGGISTGTVILESIQKPAASIVVEGNDEICGDEKATLAIDLTGTPPFHFTYSNGEEDFEVTTNENRHSFETSVAGIYSIVALSDAYCTGEGSGEVEIVDLTSQLAGELTGEDQICEGEPVVVNFSGSENIISYNWATTGEGDLNVTSTAQAVYEPASGEVGPIAISIEVSNDCISKTFSKTIEIVPTPVATFSSMPDELLSQTDITFTADVDTYDSYNWEYGDGNSGTGNPTYHAYQTPGEYEVKLTVQNEGCMGESSSPVIVKIRNDLYVPNVFNPNALNTENQVVKVYGSNVSEEDFSFKILNRWGNVMYQTSSFNTANTQGWDGKEHNNNEMQSLSAFTYVLRGKFKDGEPFEKTGTITLLQ